jgi:hypothetical protein
VPLRTKKISKRRVVHTNMENDTKSKYPLPPPIPDFSSQTEPRERTFPITVLKTPDGRCQMLFDHEYREWEAKFEAWKSECQAIDDADKASREAELAAGRPVHPENPPVADSKGDLAAGRPTPVDSPSPSESPADAINSNLANYRSSFFRSPSAYTASTAPPDLARHSIRCVVCSHPDRDAIEGDFVRWCSPIKIAEEYGISDRRNLYRHAHAVGLFNRRTQEVARILEQYMELVDHHLPDNPDKFDFDSVTRAVRVYAHLSPGLWFEPVRTHHILTGPIQPPELDQPAQAEASCVESASTSPVQELASTIQCVPENPQPSHRTKSPAKPARVQRRARRNPG